jgi:anti-sigma B factor antagonist
MIFEYELEEEVHFITIYFIGSLMEKYEAENMLTEVNEAILDGKNNFILNFKDFEYINSSGLNVLLNILTKSRNASGEAIICEVSEKLKRLFIITKLDAVFIQTSTLEEAKNKFNEKAQLP